METETNYMLSFLSFAATVITISLFFSPWPTFRDVRIKKNTGNLACTPFILSLMNCILWVGEIYGTLTNNMVVQFVNSIGTITSVIYIYVFYSNAIPLQQEKLRMHLGAAVGFLFATAILVSLSGDNGVFRLGAITSVVSIFMFGAPLEKMFFVISTKNTESMIFPLALLSFFCGLSWTLYGALLGDSFVLMPNLIATILSLIQLSLFAIYPNNPSPARKDMV